MRREWEAITGWSHRRWAVALVAAVLTAVLIAIPTAVIPNPVFGRAIDVSWWSYPIVVISGILGGLLIATYARQAKPGDASAGQRSTESESSEVELDRASKLGMAGTLAAFFAVGCPVCNKLVLLALGASGAVTWFAPVQPIIAVISIGLMAVALRIRLRGEVACAIPAAATTRPVDSD
jgi:hypothetical protein